MVEYLNCCTKPTLQTIKAIYENSHDEEILKKCDNCGAYWFFRFHEYWDVFTTWHTKITDEEAKIILQTQDLRKLNLSFLGKRESFKWEDGEITITKGQPSRPFTF